MPDALRLAKPNFRLSFRVIVCWCVVAFVSAVSAIALAFAGPQMAPVKTGSPQTFWKIACGVNLDKKPDNGWGGDAYFVDDKWVAYDAPHLHGSELYCVRADVALEQFDAVVKRLQVAVDRKDDTPFTQGYLTWHAASPQDRSANALLERINEAKQRVLATRDPNLLSFKGVKEQEFWKRWQRSRWYWANFAFEWLLFTGLTLFAVWPVIRGQPSYCCALHAAAIPSLFFLPCWLGYATFSFTSAGPTGGIVYPFVLMLTRGSSLTTFDEWMIDRLPQILEPLSTPIGIPVALTGMGMPGPTTTSVAGLFLGGIVFAFLEGIGRWTKRAALAELDQVAT